MTTQLSGGQIPTNSGETMLDVEKAGQDGLIFAESEIGRYLRKKRGGRGKPKEWIIKYRVAGISGLSHHNAVHNRSERSEFPVDKHGYTLVFAH